MNAAEFKTSLENLEEGDVVTFLFKRKVHWATHFLALFSVKPFAFEVSGENVVSLRLINRFMMTNCVSTSRYPVVCNVLRRLDQAQINMDFVVEYIFPLLDDFIVRKARKPE